MLLLCKTIEFLNRMSEFTGFVFDSGKRNWLPIVIRSLLRKKKRFVIYVYGSSCCIGPLASLSFGRFQFYSEAKYTKTRSKLTPAWIMKIGLLNQFIRMNGVLVGSLAIIWRWKCMIYLFLDYLHTEQYMRKYYIDMVGATWIDN